MTELEQNIQNYFNVSPDDGKKVAGLFTIETIEKGGHWLTAGDCCQKLSFIQQGILRVFVSQRNQDLTQWIGTQGHFITDISSFLFQNTSKFHIHAVTDARIFTLRREQYLALRQWVPTCTEFEKLVLGNCYAIMETRVFDLISMSAEDRYMQLFNQQRELFNQVPLKYLASMLGMTPETFSRIRRKLMS